MDPHRSRFLVHGYETDAFGQLEVTALTGFLAEAAGQHAAALGVGLDALMARGLTWVLARQRVEILRSARLHEELEVETWPSGVERMAALREFRVRAAGGDELARATSQWYVLDLATRRPRPPLDVLDAARFQLDAPPEPSLPGKLGALDTWELEKRFHVRYADIDLNQHVNNASYVSWALEAIPRQIWETMRLAVLDVQYRAECTLGGGILSRLAPAADGSWLHGIVREEDGQELARLTTRWVSR